MNYITNTNYYLNREIYILQHQKEKQTLLFISVADNRC